MNKVNIHFSDFFEIDHNTIESYGALDISLISDLPLFIDPFLLFNSKKMEYQKLHEGIIKYLRFLKRKTEEGNLDKGLIDRLFTFPEIKQSWFGYSFKGNSGRGLGPDFANSLYKNLFRIFVNFGNEKISKGSHLEKLCLIKDGVGRDNISDFTTNLIKKYLLEYTQEFTVKNLSQRNISLFHVDKVEFNFETELWESNFFYLPKFNSDYVLITPRDILTREKLWINKEDLVNNYDSILDSIPNYQLRARLNNYLASVLPKDYKKAEKQKAIINTITNNPEYLEYYILYKEKHGDNAISISKENVIWIQKLFINQINSFTKQLIEETKFYEIDGGSYDGAMKRINFLKEVIENKGGWRLFYVNDEPITREKDLQILYRLTWYSTIYDVSREVNDGMGFADYKVSLGSDDKTIVEFKLANNTHLKANLYKQAETYSIASDAKFYIYVIIYFSDKELDKVKTILEDLQLVGNENIRLIDARSDNKKSGSWV